MSNRVTIELEWEQIDAIVAKELQSIVDACQESIDAYESGDRVYVSIFSNDREEDIEILQKHVDAAKLLLEYYGIFHPEVTEYPVVEEDEEKPNE